MRSFEYYTPTKVIFGKDTHLKIGELLKDYNCHKVLIHYGSESAVKSGLIHEISNCLTEAGIDFVTLGGVVPNPRLSKVREGISLCQKESVDFILAVGGGSVIDSAKAIGYGVANPWTDVWNFFLKTEIPNACLPIGAIPTIAASGSGNRRDSADWKTGVWNLCFEKKIPDIGPWIGNTIANGFCRINNTSTTDSQNEIHRFFLTE